MKFQLKDGNSVFRFFLKILSFEKFEKFEILKINFLQDEKKIVRICFYCIDMFFRNPKHVFARSALSIRQ